MLHFAYSPGAYSLCEDAHSSSNSWQQKGSNAFMSRAPRIYSATTGTDVPGPGSYDSSLLQLGKRYKSRAAPRRRHSASAGAKAPAAAAAGSIAQSSVSCDRSCTAPVVAARYNPPAIPRPSQSYGYNDDGYGHLMPLPVPIPTHTGKLSDSVGPGQYSPSDALQKRSSQGTCFAKAAARRTLFDIAAATANDSSSVTAKNSGSDSVQTTSTALVRVPQDAQGSAAFRSSVDRLKQHIQPGPSACSYAPDTNSIAKTASTAAAAASTVQCFGSTSARSVWLRNSKAPYTEPDFETPGPSRYSVETVTSAFAHKPHKTLLDDDKQVGFGESSVRACLKPSGTGSVNGSSGPGPAAYSSQNEPLSLAATVQQKCKVGRKGVFGLSGDRWQHNSSSAAAAGDASKAVKASTASITATAQLWNQSAAPRRVVVLHRPKKPQSNFAEKYGPVITDPLVLAERLPPPATSYVIKVCLCIHI
jgi:Sperm-tail PG-rich repeat